MDGGFEIYLESSIRTGGRGWVDPAPTFRVWFPLLPSKFQNDQLNAEAVSIAIDIAKRLNSLKPVIAKGSIRIRHGFLAKNHIVHLNDHPGRVTGQEIGLLTDHLDLAAFYVADKIEPVEFGIPGNLLHRGRAHHDGIFRWLKNVAGSEILQKELHVGSTVCECGMDNVEPASVKLAISP